MEKIRHAKISDLPSKSKSEHKDYAFIKRTFVPRGIGEQCVVSVYELPPMKSAYPYHYHTKNEEIFYIIRGSGTLRTPEGERTVSEGELLYFPANEAGAHKLTNASPTDPLIYIDFDTCNDIDVSLYPDSGKIGIWGKGINRVYQADENVGYYDGE